MPRPPEGAVPRESTITMRVTDEDRKIIQANRFAAGDRSTSTYLRRLIAEDTAKRTKKRAG